MSQAEKAHSTPSATRRTILAGLAGVFAVAPTIVAAQAAPALPAVANPDIELFALANRFIAVQGTLNDLACRADSLEGRRNPLPDVLLYCEKDAEMRIPRPHRGEGAWDYPGSVASLRDEKWLCGSKHEDGDRLTISTWSERPSPEARARANEIIAAFDEWWPVKPRRGYKKAVKERDRAYREADRLGMKIANMPAQTIEGMRAKIRCMLAYDGVKTVDKIYLGDNAIAMSLVHDVMHAS